ncbi:MAG: UDP-glucose 4-epimerase GalE [Leadbetterella sp.]
MNILVTGGLGFIGSHTVVELHEQGHTAIIIDDLSNSNLNVINGIERILGIKPIFYQGDCSDVSLLRKVFSENKVDGVIHFAAFKAVGESVKHPLKYYANNVGSMTVLLGEMMTNKISNFVFSSSCTVYGEPDLIPVTEETPKKKATSPYGNSKAICEDILEDLYRAQSPIKSISLRYFNPIGAHHTAEIGELPNGVPSNLVPFITQTAIGKRSKLSVFGNDYNTPDGSNIRDFIHIDDLAKAHIAALEYVSRKAETYFYDVFNIGTGKGVSVLQLIETFEATNDLKLNYEIVDRRSGDVEKIYADVSKTSEKLGWKTQKTLEEALQDAWRWEQKIFNSK